ncbi:hypothetical protein KIPB_007380 [Kipferlia bialata]|uniref:Uncharacterized protein n=1 Tax=Kipferlia bialata TaxID=797122 RepID=A0A9K3D069_9EUKA|nr:hypothetical protein KIPB_007380 [Kipferlia bialata]|eukprot:g7380.t1
MGRSKKEVDEAEAEERRRKTAIMAIEPSILKNEGEKLLRKGDPHEAGVKFNNYGKRMGEEGRWRRAWDAHLKDLVCSYLYINSPEGKQGTVTGIMTALANCGEASAEYGNLDVSVHCFEEVFAALDRVTPKEDRRAGCVEEVYHQAHMEGAFKWATRLSEAYEGGENIVSPHMVKDCWNRVRLSLKHRYPKTRRHILVELALVRLLLMVEDTTTAWEWLDTLWGEEMSARSGILRYTNSELQPAITDCRVRLAAISSLHAASLTERGRHIEAANVHLRLARVEHMGNCSGGRHVVGQAYYSAGLCMLRAGRILAADEWFGESTKVSWEKGGDEQQEAIHTAVSVIISKRQGLRDSLDNLFEAEKSGTLGIGDCMRFLTALDTLSSVTLGGVTCLPVLEVLSRLCVALPICQSVYETLLLSPPAQTGPTVHDLGAGLVKMYASQADLYVNLRHVAGDISGQTEESTLKAEDEILVGLLCRGHTFNAQPTSEDMLQRAEAVALRGLSLFESMPEGDRGASLSDTMRCVQHYTRALFLQKASGTRTPLYTHPVSSVPVDSGRPTAKHIDSVYERCGADACVDINTALILGIVAEVYGQLHRVKAVYPDMDSCFKYRHNVTGDPDANWWYHTTRMLSKILHGSLNAKPNYQQMQVIVNLQSIKKHPFRARDILPQHLRPNNIPHGLFLAQIQKYRKMEWEEGFLDFGLTHAMKAIVEDMEAERKVKGGESGYSPEDAPPIELSCSELSCPEGEPLQSSDVPMGEREMGQSEGGAVVEDEGVVDSEEESEESEAVSCSRIRPAHPVYTPSDEESSAGESAPEEPASKRQAEGPEPDTPEQIRERLEQFKRLIHREMRQLVAADRKRFLMGLAAVVDSTMSSHS